MSESKLGTFNMNISLPMTTSLIASQNHFHAQNFKSLLLVWACAKTFQLEGGGLESSRKGHTPMMGLSLSSEPRSYWPVVCGSMWTQTCPLSHLSLTLSATEVSNTYLLNIFLNITCIRQSAWYRLLQVMGHLFMLQY